MTKIWLDIVIKQPFMSRKFDAPPSIFQGGYQKKYYQKIKYLGISRNLWSKYVAEPGGGRSENPGVN